MHAKWKSYYSFEIILNVEEFSGVWYTTLLSLTGNSMVSSVQKNQNPEILDFPAGLSAHGFET